MEHGSFTPLVFIAMGGMGKAAKVAYGKIATLIATKWDQPYSHVIGWMCAEFQLIEIGDHVPPWDPSSIPQQTSQC